MDVIRFGGKLGAFRRKRGLSQVELARRLDVHQSMISYLEGGRKEPSVDLVIRIADLFVVSIDDLLDDDVGVREGEANERAASVDQAEA